MSRLDVPSLTTMAQVLDSIGIAMCLFDHADRTVLWNATFLRFFPEHAGHVHAGESYRANLYRFYESRLTSAERHNIERYIEDGIARHRAQFRPFVFHHRGRALRVASLPMPDNGRVRVWTTLPDDEHPITETMPLELRQADLFSNLADGAMVLDSSSRIVAVNHEFLSLYDVTSADAVDGITFPEVIRRAWVGATGTEEGVRSRIPTFIDNARFAGAAFEVELPGERWRRVIERRMADGTAYLSHSDITVLKRQQQALSEAERQARDREERFRLITENAGDVIVSLEPDGRMQFVSPAITRVLGWAPADVTAMRIEQLIYPDDLPQFAEALSGVGSEPAAQSNERQSVLTCRLRHRSGRLIWMEAHVRLVATSGSQPVGAICSLRDITKRVSAETALREAYQQLEILAVTDQLTGIANRRRFEDALGQYGATAGAQGMNMSLLLIDVDHFKRVNDVFGHQAGDRCLQMVARTIEAAVRQDGTLVARFGGEEFAVVLSGTDATEALAVAERIRFAIEADRDHDFNRASAVTVSIGVVSIPAGSGTWPGMDALISAADRALYRAKREGRNQVAAA